MTDFVDPLEEPLGYDRDPRGALDPDAEAAYAAAVEAERREAENPGSDADADAGAGLDTDTDVDDTLDGTVATGGSEGDPLDPDTPVDNLE